MSHDDGRTRFRNLLPRPQDPRRALRWSLLRRRPHDRGVLPPNLSGAHPQVGKLPLSAPRGRRPGGRISPLPALPARGLAGDAGLAGHLGDGVAGAAIDRRGRARRGRHPPAGRAPGRRRASLAAFVSAPSRGAAAGRGAHPAGSFRQEADRRDPPADHRDRLRLRLRQHPPFQRGDSSRLSGEPAGAAWRPRPERRQRDRHHREIGVPATLRLGPNLGLSRPPGDLRRRGRGSRLLSPRRPFRSRPWHCRGTAGAGPPPPARADPPAARPTRRCMAPPSACAGCSISAPIRP